MDKRPTDADIARIERRMRFESRSLRIIIGAVIVAVFAALVLQFGGPVTVLAPILIVALLVGLVAVISWFVGYVRTDRAFASVRTEPAIRQPLWKYLLALAAALVVGVAYWGFPQYGRSIWFAYVVLGVITVIWIQRRSRRRG